jgi:ABC-type multidrug transport system ATPase subunit
VILITHRMDEAQICHRLYGMLHGRVEVTGTPDEILQDAEVRRRLALDVPEAFVLTSRLQAAGLPVKPGAPLTQVAEDLCRS